MTWAENIIRFLHRLHIEPSLLPGQIQPLYPLKNENGTVAESIVDHFYRKFYSDDRPRKFIIGINPGRLGAGATGIPFTDTKRLEQYCGLEVTAFRTHEPSSVFIYDMIDAFGGPDLFYSRYYITSVCPIGFVELKENGKWLNYNYYDSRELSRAIEPFLISKMEEQIAFGADTSTAYILGTGKNFKFFNDLNQRMGFFDSLIALEHPRYIMQYRNKLKADYIARYLEALL
jgi:hypothetical protein